MKIKKIRTIALLLFFSLQFIGLDALIKTKVMGEDQDDLMRMVVGETKVFESYLPTKVAVGNPAVVDITDVTDSEIAVTGKAPGITDVSFTDTYGEQLVKIKVIPEDVMRLKQRMDSLIKTLNLAEVYTTEAEDEGKIVILGRVKTTQEKERIMTALGVLKEKAVDLVSVKEEESVIEIDVQVLELNKDASNTLGFTWPGQVNITEMGSPGIPNFSSTSVSSTSGLAGNTSTQSFTATNTGTSWGKLFHVLNLSREAFTLTIDALVQEGKARVLSRPRLACQSGKEAELLVGGEKPTFATFTELTGTGVQIEYKEYGIKLKIKPTVTEDNRIKVALKVDVSEIGDAETIGSTTAITAKAYPLTKRTTTTELFLDDGQTLAMSGLIKQKTEEQLRKTPWLADIPVLGMFFRRKTTLQGGGAGVKGDTELFVTLTPKILSTDKPKVRPGEKKEAKAETPAVPIIDANMQSPEANYALIVQRRILERLDYPHAAKAGGFQGTTKLRMRLSHIGQLLDIGVKESSGYKILDDNALRAAKALPSYPPFPPSIDAKDLWIEIPVAYKSN